MKRLDPTPAVAPARVRVPALRMHCKTPAELAAYEARERRQAAARMNAMFPPSRVVDLDYEHMPAHWGTRPARPRHFTAEPNLGSRSDALAGYPDTSEDA